MSNLIRWEPEREMMTLREAMDHLFDEAFTRPLGFSHTFNSPSINVYETDDEVVVSASLPSLKAEDVVYP
jgi:HSP20 family protein